MVRSVLLGARPEYLTEPPLQLCDSDHIRPRQPVQNSTESRSIDAGDTSYLTNTPLTHGVSDIEHQASGNLGDRLVTSGMRPIDTQLVWGDTSWARTHAESLLPLVGSFCVLGTTAESGGPLDGCSYSRLNEEVSAAIDRFTPRGNEKQWQELEPFVVDAVTLAAPQTAYTATHLLSVTKTFVTWCVYSQGLPLKADVLFSRLCIEQFCISPALNLSEGSRRNYRSMLLRISEVLLPDEHPEPMRPLNQRSTQPPYSNAEMDQFRNWALGQNTESKRRKAMLMLALTAGAGLKSAEIGMLLREDVTADEDGIVITVHGSNDRQVPVLKEWEVWVTKLLDSVPVGAPLWGSPNRINSKNMLSSFTASTGGLAPRADRLRATWIVTHLTAGTPMKEFFRACGIRKFENLSRYLEYLPEADGAEYRRVLRGGPPG